MEILYCVYTQYTYIDITVSLTYSATQSLIIYSCALKILFSFEVCETWQYRKYVWRLQH